MKEEFVKTSQKDFIPSEETLISTKELPQEAQKLGVPTSQRILQRDVKVGILPRPIKIGTGKTVYYNRNFILSELTAIHIFKTCFQCTLNDLKAMSVNNKSKNFKDMLSLLHTILDYANRSSGVKKQGGALVFELGTNKELQTIAEKYIEKLKKGHTFPSPFKSPIEDFIHIIKNE